MIVTYAKTTRGVVRYDRQSCGFTKVFLQAGESKRAVVRVQAEAEVRVERLVQIRAREHEVAAAAGRRVALRVDLREHLG